ncbi:unnamed protein product [Macrosiphum euphorbiae]|uniref:Uncharacterized protein n=1 Tax=Macrosiphum euphorbiae TaxID=13131 RepID=A0AAV0VRA1_9HEMI|nr:unnamed protein product [Macrosiphum euphorbiae]
MEFTQSGLICFLKYVEENINPIKPGTADYIRFVKLLKTVAKKSIPIRHRRSYTPCWTKECEILLGENKKDGKNVNANRLVGLLDEERRKRWLEAMDNLDFTHSSRESFC